MKFYVAGPMRGKPLFNFPKFDLVCARIREQGHVAIGPQELDRLCGLDEFTTNDSEITPKMMRSFMIRDLMLIMTEADAVCVLPGWERSSGAKTEVSLGITLQLPVYDEFLNPLQVAIDVRKWQNE